MRHQIIQKHPDPQRHRRALAEKHRSFLATNRELSSGP